MKHLASLVDGPPPERAQHNRVTRYQQTVADAAGNIGLPYRVEGLLARLERKGDIGRRERLAGEAFSAFFRLAHLDPLHAADIKHRVTVADHGPHGSERARKHVSAALDALGGHAAPCGSVAWFVIGYELSMREYALRHGWSGRRVGQEAVKGALVGALGVLAKHFGT